MKNKHLVLLFLLAGLSALVWNKWFRDKDQMFAGDQRLTVEFLSQVHKAESINMNDGTEPNIQLVHDVNGWTIQFGSLRAAADEDSIKSLLQLLQSGKEIVVLPTGKQIAHVLIQTSKKNYDLKLYNGDTLTVQDNRGSAIGALYGPSVRHFLKPYEAWIFRKLQVKQIDEIKALTYSWDQFPSVFIEKPDSNWVLPEGLHISEGFVADTLVPALTKLNLLEPALNFDPIAEPKTEFGSLLINLEKPVVLTCYRRTERASDFYLKSSQVPSLCFKLPSELANTIFIRPMFRE